MVTLIAVDAIVLRHLDRNWRFRRISCGLFGSRLWICDEILVRSGLLTSEIVISPCLTVESYLKSFIWNQKKLSDAARRLIRWLALIPGGAGGLG
jgi:hypothetical protein